MRVLSRVAAQSRRSLRYAVVAAVAFAVGSSTVAVAGPTISGFVGLTDGANTAKIDAGGELSTVDSSVHSDLSRFGFDGNGNLRTASQGTQAVSGTVSVSNLPATQSVSGTVNIGNTPSVSVSALPSISGTVGIDPAHNVVAPVAATTTKVAATGGGLIPSTGFNPNVSFSFDSSSFKTVTVVWECDDVQAACANVHVRLSTFAFSGNPNRYVILDEFTAVAGSVMRTFDTPGIYFSIEYYNGNQVNTQIAYAIFGRP